MLRGYFNNTNVHGSPYAYVTLGGVADIHWVAVNGIADDFTTTICQSGIHNVRLQRNDLAD